MLISHERDKLINAILFFGKETKNCGKTKLFKLLYFLDFEHFKQTGRSVTGLEYHAWKMGPVPVTLYDEFNSPSLDLKKSINIKTPKLNLSKVSGDASIQKTHCIQKEKINMVA